MHAHSGSAILHIRTMGLRLEKHQGVMRARLIAGMALDRGFWRGCLAVRLVPSGTPQPVAGELVYSFRLGAFAQAGFSIGLECFTRAQVVL